MKKLILIVALLFLSACSETEKKDTNLTQTSQSSNGTISVESAKKPVAANYDTYDIDGKKSIKFGIGESTPQTRAIGAVALVKKPLESVNKQLIRAKLSKEFIVRCSACHDDYANGIIGPSLLNKTSEQIYTMIKKYKNKEKVNALMVALVDQMSDEGVQKIADEIAEFNKPFRSAK